jgi:comEA protein
MFDLEKREKIIVLVITTLLILGLTVRYYQKQSVFVDLVENSFTSDSGSSEIPEKININEADEAALIKLEGIGPSLAKRIVDYRTENGRFDSVENLKKVKGIGEKLLNRVRGGASVE